MTSVRKYVFTPREAEASASVLQKNKESIVHENKKTTTEQAQSQSKNFIKERGRMKMVNMLNVITKIPLVNGYNEYRNIRSQSGLFVKNTDIVELLLNAMQRGKILYGEKDFINLLREANIDPSWLYNENIKAKYNICTSNNLHLSKKPEIIKQRDIPQSDVVISTGEKRKSVEESEPTQNKKRKLINWKYSDDE